MPDVDDIALLREYVEHNSEFAFAGIVDLRFVRETELLDFSSGDDALADFCGVSTGGLIGNFTKLYLRHFDEQINPINLTILNRLEKSWGRFSTTAFCMS